MRGMVGITVAIGLAASASLGPGSEARAQGAIGFQPVVTPFSDGVFLNARPNVSADRRYVRFGGINPVFQSVRSVQSFGFNAGAVSGGGFGGVGGFGAVGGAGIGIVPGLGAVAPVGGFVPGWPGALTTISYGSNPYYGYPAAFRSPPMMIPQTTNALRPMAWSIMNTVAPGTWSTVRP